jgi:cytochrome c peroxidase
MPPDRSSEDDETLGARPLEPLPVTVDFDRPRAELGELLFRNPSLSGDGKVACSDCHHESHGLADDQPHTAVAGRPETALNPPTMYNVRFLYKLSWSGKYDSLESHLDALMTNPKVMASSWQRATERLSELPSYVAKFKAVFADGLTPPNVRQALLEYERSLVTPNSPFDRYLRGDAQAISSDAKQGFALFKIASRSKTKASVSRKPSFRSYSKVFSEPATSTRSKVLDQAVHRQRAIGRGPHSQAAGLGVIGPWPCRARARNASGGEHAFARLQALRGCGRGRPVHARFVRAGEARGAVPAQRAVARRDGRRQRRARPPFTIYRRAKKAHS